MLAIRLQRTGRSGHAQFRLIVQDAHLHPSSGKVVASLGSYNPHNKTVSLDKEKASFYLEHGAQPSDRVISLLKHEGVSLPKWVKAAPEKESKTRNPEKLRKNRPAEAPAEPAAESQAETAATETEAEPAEPVAAAPEAEAASDENAA